MTRHGLAALALSAAVAFAGAPAATATDGPTTATATAAAKGKKKTRAQKLRACVKKANRRSGAAKRRARSACKRKYGKKKAVGPVVPGGGGSGGVVPPPPAPVPSPPPPPPAVDPVRDDAKFREALKSSYFHRQYAIPKPNHGQGYNYHDENWEFCQSIAGHFYEGISYIYKSTGPWEVVEGNVNGDGTKGHGTIRFTQADANFAEEVGKVQTVQIQWAGDQAQIVHPEIGTNAFARQVKAAPCTQ